MNIGVVFAGGVGSRIRSNEIPKQFLELCTKPIIIYTLEHFEHNDDIDAVVISCIKSGIPRLKELLYKYRIEKVKKIVAGGQTGQISIYNGLCAAKELAGDQPAIVLIHDAVRPLISSELLSQNICAVKEFGSAITTGNLKETIVSINEDGEVVQVPRRDHARLARAPQGFWIDDILNAHKQSQIDGIENFTDSCTMMCYYGYKLHIIEGPEENVKITTQDDYYMMRSLIEARENTQFIR